MKYCNKHVRCTPRSCTLNLVRQVKTWVYSSTVDIHVIQQMYTTILHSGHSPTGKTLILFVHSRIFHSYGDITITSEGLQILTYARHSWPLSSEGSLACHPYCDTGHPFNGHLRGLVTLTPTLPSV